MSDKGYFIVFVVAFVFASLGTFGLGYYYGKNKAKKLTKEFEEKQKSVPSPATYRTSPLLPPPAI